MERKSNGSPRDALGEYVKCVFDPRDVVEVRLVPSKRSTWHDANKLPDIAARLAKENQAGQHIYVGVNPRTKKGGKKAEDVALARCLFADFDLIDPGAARTRWESAGLPEPTLTIASGHGAHAYWRLDEPLMDLREWSDLQRSLIATLGSDDAIHDAPRLMRLPGFDNCKDEPRVPCRILSAQPQNRYSLAQLRALLSPVTERTERTETTEDYRGLLKNTDAMVSRSAFADDLDVGLSGQISMAIQEALPSSIGRRHRQVFELARALKAIPALTDAPADCLRPYVKQWHRLGVQKGVIGTEPFEETWIDFLIGWPKVKFAKGKNIMDQILQEARAAPEPSAADGYEQPQLRLLVGLCSALQRQAGNKAFYLSCRTAGQLLGVSHMRANRWLLLLENDGVLSVVDRGTQAPPRATRYRYQDGR